MGNHEAAGVSSERRCSSCSSFVRASICYQDYFFAAPAPLLQVPFDFCRRIDDVSGYGHEVTGEELSDIVEGPSSGYTAMAFTPKMSIPVACNADGSLNTK